MGQTIMIGAGQTVKDAVLMALGTEEAAMQVCRDNDMGYTSMPGAGTVLTISAAALAMADNSALKKLKEWGSMTGTKWEAAVLDSSLIDCYEYSDQVINATTSVTGIPAVWEYSDDEGANWHVIDGTYNPGGALTGATFSGYNSTALVIYQIYRGMNYWLFRCNMAGIASAPCVVQVQQYSATVEAFHDAIYLAGGSISNGIYLPLLNLENALRDAEIFDRIRALYPLVGKTGISQSFNFINPANYRISWNGVGISYDLGYLKFTDGTSYGDTGLNPTDVLDADNKHLSVFALQKAVGFVNMIGVYDGGGSGNEEVIEQDTNVISGVLDSEPHSLLGPLDGKGFCAVTRNAGAGILYHKPTIGTELSTTLGTRTKPNVNKAIRLGYMGAGYFSIYATIGCATVGDELSAFELNLLGCAVWQFILDTGRV